MTVEQLREWARPLRGSRHIMLVPTQTTEIRELSFTDLAIPPVLMEPQGKLFEGEA